MPSCWMQLHIMAKSTQGILLRYLCLARSLGAASSLHFAQFAMLCYAFALLCL